MPKLAAGANDAKLAQLFTAHLEETKGQVVRLQNVFEILEEKPTGQHCGGMEGVIEEGADALEKGTEDASCDSGLVGAALRTEHYEIAGYQACISMAKELNLTEIISILTENLNEELAAAEKVTAAGQAILKQAAEEPDQDTEPRLVKKSIRTRNQKKMKRKPPRL